MQPEQIQQALCSDADRLRTYPNIIECWIPTYGEPPPRGDDEPETEQYEQVSIDPIMVHRWTARLIYFFGWAFGGATTIGHHDFNFFEGFVKWLEEKHTPFVANPFVFASVKGAYWPQASSPNHGNLAEMILTLGRWPDDVLANVGDLSQLQQEPTIIIRSYVESKRFDESAIKALGTLLGQMGQELHQLEVSTRINEQFYTIAVL